MKGTPFGEDQGIYNALTWWEQMDNGQQLTSNRKFLTVVPIVLYVLPLTLSVSLYLLIAFSFEWNKPLYSRYLKPRPYSPSFGVDEL